MVSLLKNLISYFKKRLYHHGVVKPLFGIGALNEAICDAYTDNIDLNT